MYHTYTVGSNWILLQKTKEWGQKTDRLSKTPQSDILWNCRPRKVSFCVPSMCDSLSSMVVIFSLSSVMDFYPIRPCPKCLTCSWHYLKDLRSRVWSWQLSVIKLGVRILADLSENPEKAFFYFNFLFFISHLVGFVKFSSIKNGLIKLQITLLSVGRFVVRRNHILFFSSPVHILLTSVTQMSKLHFRLLFSITLIGGNMLRNRNRSRITQMHLICQLHFRHTFIFWQTHKWAEKKQFYTNYGNVAMKRREKLYSFEKLISSRLARSAPCSHPKPTGMFSAHNL